MKITIVHGQSHKGSTYNVARKLAGKLNGEITEFFLPRDFGETCVGCTNCILKTENACPHYNKLVNITSAIDNADVLIFASPVYVYHVTGAMKSFLDHYAYRWMVHRPDKRMFSKQAVCISTAAGAGTKSTNKDMQDSFFFWGVPKVYKFGIAVRAMSFEQIDSKTSNIIEKKTDLLAKKIKKNYGKKLHIGIKTRGFFNIMRLIQKNGWCEVDKNYWKQYGWDKNNRPWKEG